MRRIELIAGQTFGRLTIVRRGRWRRIPSGDRRSRWHCLCECGRSSLVGQSELLAGKTKSCGCLKREGAKGCTWNVTHGLSKTPIWNIWSSMRQRCLDQTHEQYSAYGGRGIKICRRWGKFENFVADMGARPTPRHSLDRIDNNRGYSPKNCRWATASQQQRNRRDNRILKFAGRSALLVEWAEFLGMNKGTLASRIVHGWSVKRALTEPVRARP